MWFAVVLLATELAWLEPQVEREYPKIWAQAQALSTVVVVRADPTMPVCGDYAPATARVRVNLTDPACIWPEKTLAHELAHAWLRETGQTGTEAEEHFKVAKMLLGFAPTITWADRWFGPAGLRSPNSRPPNP